MESLEKEIEDLTNEKEALSGKISSGLLPYSELQAASARYAEVSDLVDEKEMRWLELSELA